jgi:hypothetical protein
MVSVVAHSSGVQHLALPFAFLTVVAAVFFVGFIRDSSRHMDGLSLRTSGNNCARILVVFAIRAARDLDLSKLLGLLHFWLTLDIGIRILAGLAIAGRHRSRQTPVLETIRPFCFAAPCALFWRSHTRGDLHSFADFLLTEKLGRALSKPSRLSRRSFMARRRGSSIPRTAPSPVAGRTGTRFPSR